MTNFRNAKAILLPINKKSNSGDLVLTCMGLGYHHESNKLTSFHDIQHVYVFSDSNEGSDDTIKEGDYFIQTAYSGIFKATKIDNKYVYFNSGSYEPIEYCKKIIASNDSSLNKYCWNCSEQKKVSTGLCVNCGIFGDVKLFLPNLNEQFMDEFINKFNKEKNIIIDVLVEYETACRVESSENYDDDLIIFNDVVIKTIDKDDEYDLNQHNKIVTNHDNTIVIKIK